MISLENVMSVQNYKREYGEPYDYRAVLGPVFRVNPQFFIWHSMEDWCFGGEGWD